MTLSERRIGLQEGLLKHASDLVTEKKLEHEEKIKHYEAIQGIVFGAIFLGIAFFIRSLF